MRVGGFFHPSYPTHVRPLIESSMLARAEVYKPTGQHPEWVAGEGMKDNSLQLVWRGNARVQPNIDWRARVRDFAGEFDATMAVRIQLPIGKNEIGGFKVGNDWDSYGTDPNFAMGYVVRVTFSPVEGTQMLLHRDYTVRNSLPSSNMWEYNLLCDVGTNPNG